MICGQEESKAGCSCGNSAEYKLHYLCAVIVQTDSKLGEGEQGKINWNKSDEMVHK